MKQIVKTIVASLLLLVVLCGCFGGRQHYKIDLIVKGTDSEFWQSLYDGAKAAASIYNVDLNLFGPEVEKNYRDQIGVIQQSIKRRPDSMILAAGDYNLMAKPMEQAVAAGIPVVMVDSAVDSDKWVSFVTTDNEKAGSSLAEQLIQRTEASGTVGVISFVKESYPSVAREKGFLTVMNSISRFNLLDTVFCDSNIEEAERLTLQMVEEHPDLVAIAALNAYSAIGATHALEKLGRSDIFLAGIDCMTEEADYLESGILDVAVLQNPYLMGYYSVETAVRNLKGEHVEKNILTDISIVDKDNMFSDEIQQLIFPFY